MTDADAFVLAEHDLRALQDNWQREHILCRERVAFSMQKPEREALSR